LIKHLSFGGMMTSHSIYAFISLSFLFFFTSSHVEYHCKTMNIHLNYLRN